MNVRFLPLLLLGCAVALTATGCNDAPGKPKLASEYERPERVFDFATLYKQNCAACHGESGRNGAAISLANPVYIATAGVANISRVTSAGVAGTMMPAFGIKAGGTLTDRQVQVIAQGIADTWGQASALGGQAAPRRQERAHGRARSGLCLSARRAAAYFAKSWLRSAKALNSSALPDGSKKNIVACSPT